MIVAILDEIRRKSFEIEQIAVQQMRRTCVREGAEHDLPSAGAVLFPAVKNGFHLLALQSVLTAA